jgi:uncharacterized protein YciI
LEKIAMFAIILEYKKPIEEIERHTAEHRAFLDEYYAQGVLVMSGRQTSAKGGVISTRLTITD